MLPDGYLRTAVRDAHGHRRGRRRRLDGGRGRHPVPAGRGLGHDLARSAWARPPTTPAATPGPADTVYLGVYRREAIEKVGGYDETMLIAEDWELNYRIRAAGGLIWFTPDLKVTYRPRATLAALAKQQFRYGRWRRVVARRYPETVNLPLPGPAGRDRAQRRRGWSWRGRAHRTLAGARRTRCVPDPRVRYSGRLPGRGHRGRRDVRPRPAARRAGAGPAGAGHHAPVLGRGLPDQPSPAGQAALTRLSACGRASGGPPVNSPDGLRGRPTHRDKDRIWASIWRRARGGARAGVRPAQPST